MPASSWASIVVWDLPVRLFHWLLAGGFAVAAFVALVLGEESPLFPSHAIIGLTLAMMIGLRLLWGIVGTRHARFSSFAFSPKSVLDYLHGVATGRGVRHIGHNPASAYAIVAMLALLVGLTVTGVMMSRGAEGVKAVHELMSYAMLAVVAIHVLGVAIHTIRFRENITRSMIDGRKAGDASDGIASAQPVAAIVALGITAAWAAALVANYDATTATTEIPLVGTRLVLGDSESPEAGDDD